MSLRSLSFVLFGMLVSMSAALGVEETALAPGLVNPGYEEQPEWFKHSFLDIREDVKEAKAAHRRLMLYFYQDGCPYCRMLLQDNWGQRPIADKTRQYFDVIALNIVGDAEVTDLRGKVMTEKLFAREMQVMFTPTLVMLDERGKVAMRINGYYDPVRFSAAVDFAGQGMERKKDFETWFATQSPPALQGRLHDSPQYLQPPFRLDEAVKTSSKPLLVMFEQKQCQACDELHLDILQRPESAELLARFQVVLLDMWSAAEVVTPAGRKTTAQKWARELHVPYAPTLVFFDAAGSEVFRIEAYLKAFHVQSVLDYVASGAYRQHPGLQRFIEARADGLRKRGIAVDLMK
ncbi:MAG TPA: thioredoxin fold domain-containing protein [Gallionellaceae bacterium]|nr:thioredoxin fold domain-containing protein [Gallionellaceae bacterium]